MSGKRTITLERPRCWESYPLPVGGISVPTTPTESHEPNINRQSAVKPFTPEAYIKPIVQFIVNADDLGRSESINDAIFSAISDGVITSSTLMATGQAIETAAQEAKSFSIASFGVHMNLTDHRPVTGDPDLAPLLNTDGIFGRNNVYEAKWTPSLQRAVVREWVAQVRLIERLGIKVSHLDSHHHVHTIPGLFLPLKRVQRETGIQRVRGTWTVYDRAAMPGWKLRASKRVWLWALRHIPVARTPAEFSDFLMFQRAVAEGSYAPTRWPKTIELMVHPTKDSDSVVELAALRGDWLLHIPVRARLTSYLAV